MLSRFSCYKNYALIVASVLLTSCASGPTPRPIPRDDVSSAKSRIILTRTDDFLYLALDARVSVNSKVVASLPRGETTYVDINPGGATVRVDHPTSPGAFAISFPARPGRVYRIEVSPRSESFLPGAMLGIIGSSIDASITENSGLFMVKNLSYEVEEKSSRGRQLNSEEDKRRKLQDLKKLKDDGLIDEDVYKEQQLKILSGD